ncbi:MAG: hypothetical protein NC394_07075 [Bacteroides sp.]|nr:hypothetical protein [Bacteroides sp.]
MKKLISLLLSAALMISTFAVGAYAAVQEPTGDEIMPMYVATSSIKSSLTINNKNVECKTAVILYNGEKWHKIVQTLEKQNSNGKWESTSLEWSIDAVNKSQSYVFVNSSTLSETAQKFRVKSVVTVESSGGTRQDITCYSSEVSA